VAPSFAPDSGPGLALVTRVSHLLLFAVETSLARYISLFQGIKEILAIAQSPVLMAWVTLPEASISNRRFPV
jgi:hypothetical protein